MAAGRKTWSHLREKISQDLGSPSLSKDIDPELCAKLIQKPSTHNYSSLKTILQQASEGWMKDFLEFGGMEVLLQSLERLESLNTNGFLRAVMQLECVYCIKSILNSTAGLSFLSENIKFTRQLGRGLELFTFLFTKLILINNLNILVLKRYS